MRFSVSLPVALAVALALFAAPSLGSAQQVRKHDAKRAQCQKQAMRDNVPPEKMTDFIKTCMERKALERAGVKQK